MSASAVVHDINQLVHPEPLSNLKGDMPRVMCIVWKGGNIYDTITIDVLYPFDTIDALKRAIYVHYNDNAAYLPRFVFIGVPTGTDDPRLDSPPGLEIKYIPADYLWFPVGKTEARDTIVLQNPRQTVRTGDSRFSTPDGSFPTYSSAPRGRSTLEDVFLHPRNGILPVFHIYSLHHLMSEYRGTYPIPEQEWNRRFAPYFIDVPSGGPYTATDDDIEFAKTIHIFVKSRIHNLQKIDKLLGEIPALPDLQMTGIRQLRLVLSKPPVRFEGCESLFYKLRASETRPFIRLIPSSEKPITKIHIKGVIPIPTVDNPEVILQWTKDISPTPEKDFISMKYVQRRKTEFSPSIYGTIRVFNDGSSDILIQPHKSIRRLDPTYDFAHFSEILTGAMQGMPHNISAFRLGEMTAIFSIKIGQHDQRFTRKRLLKRFMTIFQTLFHEITPLGGQAPILSIRYKAVSQYATEDKYFSFLTQFATEKLVDGETFSVDIVKAVQLEFEISEKDAKTIVKKWLEQRGSFTIAVPEEREFMESYNPGIDIHIYSQHPFYVFHLNRVDSIESYNRITTLMRLLFSEDDSVFGNKSDRDELNSLADTRVEDDVIDSESASYGFRPGSSAAAAASTTATHTGKFTPREQTLHGVVESGEEAVADTAEEEMSDEMRDFLAAQANAWAPAAQEVRQEPINSSQIPPPQLPRFAEDDISPVDPRSWFIKKLREIDPGLFTRESADGVPKDESVYSRLCQASEDKQPVVLTQVQYDRMIEEYDKDQQDDEIVFLLYPLRGTFEPAISPNIKEIYSLLQYGSDPLKQNYYFCPYLYCLRDEIMVRPKDFKSSSDREGKPKPPDTCPFCRGRMFDAETRKRPTPGFTVVRRKHKKTASTARDAFSTDSPEAPVYVGFHKGTISHTSLAMPCCFLKMSQHIRLKDTPFDKLRKGMDNDGRGDNIIDDDGSVDIERDIGHERHVISYAASLQRVHSEYILGADKHPLDAGKFALLTPQLDSYFSQDSGKIAERVQIRTTLKPKSEGFIRMGTEFSNTESVLGVIAPLIGKNSIREVKDIIVEKLIPRLFISVNFGNFVNEFFNPADISPTDNELRLWSSTHLEVDVNSENGTALSKIFRAYKRFIMFLNDPMQKKECRHILPIIGQPNLFTKGGMVAAILEEDGDNVVVKCPMYGISALQRDMSEVAFIFRHPNDVYDLLIFTKNVPGSGMDGTKHETIIKWSHISRETWPEIVKVRVSETLDQCSSRFVGLYTSQSIVDNNVIPPVSMVIDTMRQYPEGVIRDSYNRLVALTFRTRSGKKISPLAILPVIDDGILSGLRHRIHLGWSDIDEAPLSEVLQFYKGSVEPLFTMYPGYKIKYLVRRRADTDNIIAIQLENGLYVPVKSSAIDSDIITRFGQLSIVEIDEFEWEINQKISGISEPCGKTPSDVDMNTGTDDTYITFKMMVANWISSTDAGPNVRKTIEDTVFNHKLPNFEKRKRLDILLTPVFTKWFLETKDDYSAPFSIMRRDCRSIGTEDACIEICGWVDGRCLFKVKETTTIGTDKDAKTVTLYIKRIIDELSMFHSRREKLLHRGISKLSKILEPIKNDDQYIIPEIGENPFSILHLDWTYTSEMMADGKKFYEEMSST